MRSAQWAIQTIIFQRLTTDPRLREMNVKVFDGPVPGDQSIIFPYIIMQGWREEPRNKLSERGRMVFGEIHVWSSYPGNKEISTIDARVQTLLENRSNELNTDPDWTVVLSQLDATQLLIEDTRHLVCRYQWLLHER